VRVEAGKFFYQKVPDALEMMAVEYAGVRSFFNFILLSEDSLVYLLVNRTSSGFSREGW